MAHLVPLRRASAAIVVFMLLMVVATSSAQEPRGEPRPPSPPLADAPQVFNTPQQQFRVVPIKGLSNPWALAFLPDGNILITEKSRRTLRIVRNGVLDPQPIAGLPQGINVTTGSRAGLDIALHPRFAENKLVYFTYYKPKSGDEEVGTPVLARGRFDGGTALTDVRDLFVADAWIDAASATRMAFGRDGKIYMVIGVPLLSRAATPDSAQNPGNHAGKVLRLNDDGSAPPDNPFVGRAGYRPEIYALGIRNPGGLFVHPETGEVWETEHGPQGGDEINIIKAGLNYGWPAVTFGRAYNWDLKGERSGLPPPSVQPPTAASGMEPPFTVWIPSIATSGITFYTGDRFPAWKGNIFVGGLRGARLERVMLNRQGLENRRETLLTELGQRIRDVRQGPDGLLYLTTDEKDGALLRIEPVAADPVAAPIVK